MTDRQIDTLRDIEHSVIQQVSGRNGSREQALAR